MTRTIPVTGVEPVGVHDVESVREELERHATLEDLLHWCLAQSPRRDLRGVVVQDEYTHDVIVEMNGGLFAVYDTT